MQHDLLWFFQQHDLRLETHSLLQTETASEVFLFIIPKVYDRCTPVLDVWLRARSPGPLSRIVAGASSDSIL